MKTRLIFSNKNFLIMLFFLVLQQVIVASSSLWIIDFIKNIQTKTPFYLNLSLYLASLIVPFVPGCFALIFLEKWKLNLTLKLSEIFKEKYKAEQKIWSDNNLKETRLSILSGEGMNVVFNFTEYVHNLIATLINAVFNITVLSILIDISFGIGYFSSLLIVGACIKFWKNKQEQLTEKAQNTRIGFLKILLRSWDNVVLGNKYNFNLWDQKLAKRGQAFSFRDLHAKKFRQWSSVIIAFFTFIPSFFAVVYSIGVNSSNPLFLGAIAVTLPRLFLILNYTYELLNQLFNWPYQKSMLSRVNQILCEVPLSPFLLSRIKWEKLRYTYVNEALQSSEFLNISSMEELLSKTKSPGKITIRGENGSGKSTLLLMLKDALRDKAFFLPHKHHLIFKKNIHSSSSGQGIKLALEEIQRDVKAEIILLDEWDANLDQYNQKVLSQLIDEIAQKYCVIEVRHRM